MADELKRTCTEAVEGLVTVSEFAWLATCFHASILLELFNPEDGGDIFL
jgi:hypothetical protein